jgi:RNA polymerase sigma-70 factor, ECF subfamily
VRRAGRVAPCNESDLAVVFEVEAGVDGRIDNDLSGLMRAALAGDEAAYAEFLRRVAQLMHRFARRKVGSSGIDAEDIVQETLLAIHAKRHTWRDDSPITPWLFAIARYKLIDAMRRRNRRMEVDIADFAETLSAPETEAVNWRDVGRGLDTLAPGQRSVVTAISVEGRSIGETARTLGMSEGAVRVALHRGLAAIARRFGKD